MRRFCAVLVFLLVLVLYIELIKGTQPPTHIFANGKDFPVYYSETNPDDLQSLRTGPKSFVYGQTFCEDSEIKENYIQISPNQPLDDMRDTLWHEAKHAANGCASLAGKLKSDPDYEYDNLYETEVPEELQLMHNNPQLMHFIEGSSSWLR